VVTLCLSAAVAATVVLGYVAHLQTASLHLASSATAVRSSQTCVIAVPFKLDLCSCTTKLLVLHQTGAYVPSTASLRGTAAFLQGKHKRPSLVGCPCQSDERDRCVARICPAKRQRRAS